MVSRASMTGAKRKSCGHRPPLDIGMPRLSKTTCACKDRANGLALILLPLYKAGYRRQGWHQGPGLPTVKPAGSGQPFFPGHRTPLFQLPTREAAQQSFDDMNERDRRCCKVCPSAI